MFKVYDGWFYVTVLWEMSFSFYTVLEQRYSSCTLKRTSNFNFKNLLTNFDEVISRGEMCDCGDPLQDADTRMFKGIFSIAR